MSEERFERTDDAGAWVPRIGELIGPRLRNARRAAGFSQNDLEERSGVPKARLSRYENGHVVPTLETLDRIARAFDVSVSELTQGL